MTSSKAAAVIIILALLLTASACAELSAEITMGGDLHESIQVFRSEKGRMLFLPSGVSAEGVTFPETVGLSQPLTLGENSIRVNGNNVKLNILASGGVMSVFIDTDRLTLEKFGQNKTLVDTGSCRIYNSDGKLINSGKLAEFRLHGNSSLHPEKRSYKIKFETKQGIAGMEKDKTWLLIANTFDNSYTRNFIAHRLAQALEIPFDPEYRIADLYVNGDYRGTYMLSEKIQVGKGRVEIADLEEATEEVNDKPLSSYPAKGPKSGRKGLGKYYLIEHEPEDITGGYLLELTIDRRYTDAASAYVTTRGQTVRIRSPKYVSQKQYEYISRLIQSAENAFFAEDGRDPETGKTLEELVDLDSLASKYLLEELLSNFDGNKASQYFYKPADAQDTRLIWGPAWDYDLCLGNRYEETTVFVDPQALALVGERTLKRTTWWTALYQRQPAFRKRLNEIFNEKAISAAVAELVDGGEDAESIDRWMNGIDASLTMNYTRWKFVTFIRQIKRLQTVPEQVNYVKDFLRKRVAFLETEWAR